MVKVTRNLERVLNETSRFQKYLFQRKLTKFLPPPSSPTLELPVWSRHNIFSLCPNHLFPILFDNSLIMLPITWTSYTYIYIYASEEIHNTSVEDAPLKTLPENERGRIILFCIYLLKLFLLLVFSSSRNSH